MKRISTPLSDAVLFEPRVFGDHRGFFMETYKAQDFHEAGIPYPFVQDNHSGSGRGVLRGLHYQIHQPQGKLVRAVVGEIYDVILDIRRSSPSFGKWYGAYLSAQNRLLLWVPPGFAHGFFVVSEWAELVYKATDYYAPEWDRAILWNDPALGIDWPIPPGEFPIISQKDQEGRLFHDAEVFD